MNKAPPSGVDLSNANIIRPVDAIHEVEVAPAATSPNFLRTRKLVAAVGLAASVFITGCSGGGDEPGQPVSTEATFATSTPETTMAVNESDTVRMDIDSAYSQMKAYYLHSCSIEDIEVTEMDAPQEFTEQGRVPALRLKYWQVKFEPEVPDPNQDFTKMRRADNGTKEVGLEWDTSIFAESFQGDDAQGSDVWKTKPIHTDPTKLRAKHDVPDDHLATDKGTADYEILIPLIQTKEKPGIRTVRFVYHSTIKHRDEGRQSKGYVEQKDSDMICGEIIVDISREDGSVKIHEVTKDHANFSTELAQAAP
jgi:hypothetical protein